MKGTMMQMPYGKVVATLGIVAVLSIAGCTSDEAPKQLDPTVLPQSEVVTAAPIKPSDLPADLPGSAPSVSPSGGDTTVVVGESYDVAPLPEKLPSGAVIYPNHDGTYLVVDPQDPTFTDAVIEDTEDKIAQIPLKDTQNGGEQMGIRGTWFQEMSEQMINATGMTPVIVYSISGPASADSKETSTVWGYWVIQGDTITMSPFEPTKKAASQAAQEWIADQPKADAFVLISEG